MRAPRTATRRVERRPTPASPSRAFPARAAPTRVDAPTSPPTRRPSAPFPDTTAARARASSCDHIHRPVVPSTLTAARSASPRPRIVRPSIDRSIVRSFDRSIDRSIGRSRSTARHAFRPSWRIVRALCASRADFFLSSILDPRPPAASRRARTSRSSPGRRARCVRRATRRDATRDAGRARDDADASRARETTRRRDDARGPAEAREVRRDRAERGLTTTTTTTGFERRMSAAMSAKARTVVKLSATTRKSRGGTGRRGATTRAANGEKPWGDSTQCVQNGASNDEERRAMDARWCIKM